MAATLNDGIEQLEDFAHRRSAEEKSATMISTAKTRLVLAGNKKNAMGPTSCFYASLIMQLRYSPDWDIDTAATDGRRLIYNPDFILGLSDAEVIGLLAHEAMHCANKHMTRRSWREAKQWNIACDIAINQIIKDSGFTLPSGALFPGVAPFQNMPPNLSAEEYYGLLGDPEEDDGGASSGEGTGGDPGGCGGVIDPSKGDGSPVEEFEKDQLEREWQQHVSAAQQAAEKRGTMPGGISRLCAAALAPSHDWKAELRQYLSRSARVNYDWRRPNRRHVHRGFYLPTLRGRTIGHVVVMIDTSGSINDDTLRRFASEIGDIAAQGVAKLTTIYHHTQAYRTSEWTPDDGPYEISGCESGGTCHRDAFDKIASLDEEPAVVICLTDLESSFPLQPSYEVLWVSTNPRARHPWSDRIDIPAQ